MKWSQNVYKLIRQCLLHGVFPSLAVIIGAKKWLDQEYPIEVPGCLGVIWWHYISLKQLECKDGEKKKLEDDHFCFWRGAYNISWLKKLIFCIVFL